MKKIFVCLLAMVGIMSLKAQTQVVVNAIKESIDMNEDSIAYWEEEIDTWSSVESRLEYILIILQENCNEWELRYRNS